ncbi:MAG: pilus assembly protein PilP [Betaproteobacteria bacterium]|nr:pilus assembly protein PilP [Betaproteobacteria bacterium]
MRHAWLTLLATGLISGCGGTDGLDDLRQFMDEAGKKNAPKVKPLPPPQAHDTFVYQAEQVPDPFTLHSAQGAAQTDGGRAQGTLEEYGLDNLHVAGVVERNGTLQALIATPDSRLLAAKVGDRVGRNGGTVIEITYKGVKIKERVASKPGKWKEVVTELNKPQETDIREMKRDPSGKWSNPN